MRLVISLRNSLAMTAVVAMNMSPCRVRTYRITRMSRAFCKVKVTRLTYLSIPGMPEKKKKKKTNQ